MAAMAMMTKAAAMAAWMKASKEAVAAHKARMATHPAFRGMPAGSPGREAMGGMPTMALGALGG
jgi:hypothetical protein